MGREKIVTVDRDDRGCTTRPTQEMQRGEAVHAKNELHLRRLPEKKNSREKKNVKGVLAEIAEYRSE